MDRAYNDDPLFAEWTAAGLFFVTHLKDNADYEVTNERRGVVRDEANQRQIVLRTNHLEFGATTIVAIDQDRWQIELLFKTLKVETFIGTSENALRIQLSTALIALRLLKWLHDQAPWSGSSNPSGRHWICKQAQKPYNCISRCPVLDSTQ